MGKPPQVIDSVGGTGSRSGHRTCGGSEISVSLKLVETYRVQVVSTKLKNYHGEVYPLFWNVSLESK